MSIQNIVNNWSMFDMLCLIYVIKDAVIMQTAVLSAFIYSSGPEEAQQILHDMKKKQGELSLDNSLDMGEIQISEQLYESIFKKGLIKNTLKSILPTKSIKTIKAVNENTEKVVNTVEGDGTFLKFKIKRKQLSSISLLPLPLFDESFPGP